MGTLTCLTSVFLECRIEAAHRETIAERVETNEKEEFPMHKLLPITAVALMCSTGMALAVENPSGRPGQVLNDQKCQQAWKAAGPDGDNLSENAAKPYILNFAAVDTSNDRKISADEWKVGCDKGWVSADAREVTPKADPAGQDAEMNKSGASNPQSDDAMKDDSSQNKSSY